MAKNRLNKFYNPKLAKFLQQEAPASLLQVHMQIRSKDNIDAPPQPPALLDTAKKTEEARGVLAMMDMMKADVEKETQEAEFAEKDAQGEYEQMVKDAAAKRAADKKTIEQKLAVKAGLEEELVKLG